MLIMRPIQLHGARQPKPRLVSNVFAFLLQAFGAVRDYGTSFFEIAELPVHDDGSALPESAE